VGLDPVLDSITVDTDTLYVDKVNHRVGMNTTTPNTDLQILRSNASISLGQEGVNGNWMSMKADQDAGWADFKCGFRTWQFSLNETTGDAKFRISRVAADIIAMRGGYDNNSGNNIVLVLQGGQQGDGSGVAGANLYLRGGYSTGATQGRVKIQSSDGITNYMSFAMDGKVGINDDSPAEYLDVNGNVNVTGVYKVDDVQVVGSRVVDERADDTVNTSTWDSTTAGVLDALRDAMISHGLIAAS